MRQEIFGNLGWYPLKTSDLERMLKESDLPDNAVKYKAKALIAPHAGYLYSLGTAAKAYNHLDSAELNKVILCGVSHTTHFGNRACLPEDLTFATPYGNLSLSEDNYRYILSERGDIFFKDNSIHRAEHSLEMQFPLIRKFIGEVKILPLLFSSDADFSKLQEAGQAISDFCDENTLLIISTDLSHFPVLKNALKIDHSVIESWKTMDPRLVYEEELKWHDTPLTSCGSCGVNAVCVGLAALKEKYKSGFSVVENYYSNSYDISKDARRVVGYGSAVIV